MSSSGATHDGARRLAEAREDFLATGRVRGEVRPLVAASWLRCLAQGTGASSPPPVDLHGEALDHYRGSHSLARVMPLVRRLLADGATEAGFLVAVSDTAGRLLWVDGAPDVLDAAAEMGFAPGALWSEEHAGTNAPGTALALGDTVQITADEHLADAVTGWSCTAAPLRDPRSGELLGALDITGGGEAATPFARCLVRSVQAAVEAELLVPVLPASQREEDDRSAPGSAAGGGLAAGGLVSGGLVSSGLVDGSEATGQPVARLTALGRDRALLWAGSGEHTLSLRHAELLVLLALHPDGLSADQLGVRLREEDPAQVTVRAELSRLRAVLARTGGPALRSRPYRLAEPGPGGAGGALATDVADVRGALGRGDVAAAVSGYAGPLLPRSTAPAVVELREDLHGDLRAAVLASGRASLLWAWSGMPAAHDDLEVWERIVDVEPAGSVRSVAAQSRIDRLHSALAS